MILWIVSRKQYKTDGYDVQEDDAHANLKALCHPGANVANVDRKYKNLEERPKEPCSVGNLSSEAMWHNWHQCVDGSVWV
mmetsp:Transcript_4298/g.7306  ORF Transcript_4298/g.7306 Transcript_4298/m.7306 type:complete len:80 (+) Transcript_4298:503-742(+)